MLRRKRIGSQPAKVAPFAGGNEADVRKMAAGHFSNANAFQCSRAFFQCIGRSRQKSRLLPAVTKPMSEKWPQGIFPMQMHSNAAGHFSNASVAAGKSRAFCRR
ncbi:MAG: hypothetical protein ACJ8R9_28830 [Steroidobacteraceae bacterium]